MFKKGDFVVYGSTGVCEVLDVTTMDLEGIPDDKLYYILKPYQREGSEIFAPVDNQRKVIRAIIPADQAKALLDKLPKLEEFQISSEKFREDSYKKCIRECCCEEMMKMMKTLHHKKMHRLAKGKHFPSTDERYLRIVEENLLEELAFSLKTKKENISKYVYDHMKEVAMAQKKIRFSAFLRLLQFLTYEINQYQRVVLWIEKAKQLFLLFFVLVLLNGVWYNFSQ